eukprot:jgi/Hompol1/3093/HPOL_006356-RA
MSNSQTQIAVIPIEYLSKPEYAFVIVLYAIVGLLNLTMVLRSVKQIVRRGMKSTGISTLVIFANIRELFVALMPIMAPGYKWLIPWFDKNPDQARICVVFLHFFLCWPLYVTQIWTDVPDPIWIWYNIGAAIQAVLICSISGIQGWIIIRELLRVASIATNQNMEHKRRQVISWTILTVLVEVFGLAMFVMSAAVIEPNTPENTLTSQYINASISFEVASESVVTEMISSIVEFMQNQRNPVTGSEST